MLPMEYGMIRFTPEDSYVVEDILIVLSRFFPARPVKGYSVEVADSLRGGLSFLEGDGDTDSLGKGLLLSLARVYVSMDEEGGSVLIAADSMEERARWISSQWKSRSGENFNGVIHHTYQGNGWSLVGIATPGWMVLFDDETENAEQDWLEADLRVAYLPPDDEVLEFLSPEKTSAEVLSLLAEYLLFCLPSREESPGI